MTLSLYFIVTYMAHLTYRPLNSHSGPRASKSRWALYILCILVDLTFLMLSFTLCYGQMTRVKWWLLVKFSGAMVYRFVSVLEFANNMATYVELLNRLRTRDYRLKYQMSDPSVPRHDLLPFIYAAFELVCIFATIVALTNNKGLRPCGHMRLTAAISTTVALVKYVTCIYSGCFQCRHRGQE